MAKVNGGEILLRCLSREGVRIIFALPDASYNPVLAKIREYNIRLVPSRHESAGGHMADAWSRVTGEPGVCMAGMGPGAANLLPALICARAEGSPVIAITSARMLAVSYPDRHGAFQCCNQSELFHAATKWNATITHAKRLPELVERAFRAATSGRPGPVHLDIPSDVFLQEIDESEVELIDPEQYRCCSWGCDQGCITEAAAMLLSASSPVIHPGVGVLRSGAWDQVAALAHHLSIPVVPSVGARGIMAEDDPLFFHPLSPAAFDLRVNSDLVVAIGTQLAETDFWGKPPMWGDPSTQKLIHIDQSSEILGANRPFDLALLGDAKVVLSALLKKVQDQTAERHAEERLANMREMEKRWSEELIQLESSTSSTVHPARMVSEVRKFFPRKSIFVMDGGNTSLWSYNYYTIYQPRGFLWTSKFGHLGSGLPYAIAAKLALPDMPVCLITGDGAFGFNLPELETARRENAPVVVVVNCDSRWSMELPGQLAEFPDRIIGIEHHPVRYDRVAIGLGCHGEFVDAPDQIALALERATASGLPAVIHVAGDRDANVTPPGLETFAAIFSAAP